KQADTVLKWEEERRSAEAKLREKRAELERLTEREKEMARVRETVTRLSGEIETLEREMRSALDSEGLVAGIGGLEARDRKVVEEIATIRAVIDLDRRTLAEMKGGLCPLLSERCLNMKEGQGLDQYFKGRLGTDEERLSQLDAQRIQILAELDTA